MAEIKENRVNVIETNRAISNPINVISNLYEKRYESGVIAQVQNELGLRVSEAFEIVQNIEKYYNQENGTIENLIGKGNHIYNEKNSSSQLYERIKVCDKIPSQNTYRNDLKEQGVDNSHDWRYTYAKGEFEAKIENGVEYNQALREVSEELNHSRGSMTLFYLNRG